MGLRRALVIALVIAVIHDSNPIAIASPVSSDPTRQKPFSFSPSSGPGGPNLSDARFRGRNGPPLKGRFLHVTDIVSLGAIFRIGAVLLPMTLFLDWRFPFGIFFVLPIDNLIFLASR
jgi:hypothetical protein